MLSRSIDTESLKENKKDEEIVDAEGRLDRVPGDKLKRPLPALHHADPRCEYRGSQHQHRRPQPRRSLGLCAFAAVHGQIRVDGQQQDHGPVEPEPPNPRCAGNHY